MTSEQYTYLIAMIFLARAASRSQAVAGAVIFALLNMVGTPPEKYAELYKFWSSLF